MLTARAHIGGFAPKQIRRLSWVIALLAFTALAAALPARAGAAVASGALSQPESLGCIGEEAAQKALCATNVPFGLNTVFQSQVSPDGLNVYSVSISGDLTEYARDQANGSLSVIGCITSQPHPCASENVTEGVAIMESPTAIALSPDGKFAYIATSAGTVVELERDPVTGLLSVMGGGHACVTGEAGGECEIKSAPGINVPYGVTVSPDGENVYVASVGGEAVAEFSRSASTGLLSTMPGNECIGGGISGCPQETAVGMHEPIGVVVSPDGEDLYVAAGAGSEEGDIAAFKRGAGGALEQLEGEEACISEKVSGCAKGIAVQGSEDLVVSQNGEYVYATSYPNSAVIELKRESSGALTQLAANNACITNETIAGCTTVKSIGNPRGVALSPDGKNLYVSSSSEASVAAFTPNAGTGALEALPEPYECVTTRDEGCATNGLVGLEGARRIVVSPDGTNLYVAGQEAHAIVELARTIQPTVTAISPKNGPEGGETQVTIEGSGFNEFVGVDFGSTPAASVTVNSAESITAVSPAGSGSKLDVTVSNPVGTSPDVPADQFTYNEPLQPTIGSIGPTYGSESGGTQVTIIGSEFRPGASVHFGANPAPEVVVDSESSITATSPAGAGTVDITVTTAKGTSPLTSGDRFKYVYVPPHELGGLDLEGYCESLGYERVVLSRGGTSGEDFAYKNWACVRAGQEVLIEPAGVPPSMDDACVQAFPGVASFAYPPEENDANSWNCYEEVPTPAKEGGGGGGETKALISTSKTTPPATIPPPVLAKTGNVAPVSGAVRVRLPGSSTFVALSEVLQIPFGSVVDATNGKVSVTSAVPGGGTQTGIFFDGEFILTQGKDGVLVATLTGGDFSVCPTARERSHIARASSAHASPKHVVRKLWANAHGKFSTKGNYAAGAVLGTEWLTEDLCDGTLIRVTRDKVAVTNLVNHRHKTVKAKHSYLAKAP